jgi:hypothetical protein
MGTPTEDVCPTPTEYMIETAKKSKFGGTWFSPEGAVTIDPDGSYDWLVKKKFGINYGDWKRKHNTEVTCQQEHHEQYLPTQKSVRS